ncbi:hypothetical protein SB748_04505 [Rhizobium sp. SIMBA_035]
MSKAVLTTKVDPTYDDLPEQRYEIPRTYLRQIEAARGDWIVYYEPRRPSGDLMKTGGKQAYFATARITDIIQDPSKADHFYALVDDFLPFSIMPYPSRTRTTIMRTAFARRTALRTRAPSGALSATSRMKNTT